MNCPELRVPRWRVAVALFALGPALLCPPAQARAEIIWEGDDQSVLLAPQDDESAPPNDHPVTMAPQDIESLLAGLRLRYADQGTDASPVAVFTEEQVEILGEALATGLASAEPSQDVTFSVIGAHRLSAGAFARRNRVTAGRAFYRDGKLNVIFGEIQSPYRKKNIYGRTDEDFYPREYGSREAPEEHESVLIASAAASLGGDPESARHDWVVFDPQLARAEPAQGSPPPAATSSDAAEAAPGASRPAGAPADPAIVETSPRPEETERKPEISDSDDIEQRLERLKRLRDKALISEEAYRKKVDEILEDL